MKRKKRRGIDLGELLNDLSSSYNTKPWPFVVIAKTIKNGKEFAEGWGLEPVEIYSTGNSIRGHSFKKTKSVYVTTDDIEIWRVLLPAIDGAKVFPMFEYD